MTSNVLKHMTEKELDYFIKYMFLQLNERLEKYGFKFFKNTTQKSDRGEIILTMKSGQHMNYKSQLFIEIINFNSFYLNVIEFEIHVSLPNIFEDKFMLKTEFTSDNKWICRPMDVRQYFALLQRLYGFEHEPEIAKNFHNQYKPDIVRKEVTAMLGALTSVSNN